MLLDFFKAGKIPKNQNSRHQTQTLQPEELSSTTLLTLVFGI